MNDVLLFRKKVEQEFVSDFYFLRVDELFHLEIKNDVQTIGEFKSEII